MEKQFSSKYNIGLHISESIHSELGMARGFVERGLFNKAFVKYMGIMSLIPSKKIKVSSMKKFKALDKLYHQSQKQKNLKLQYKIIVKYREILTSELDSNGMYLPGLKDMTDYT